MIQILVWAVYPYVREALGKLADTFLHLGSPVCETRLLRPAVAMLQSDCESSMEGVFGMSLAKLPSEAGERGSCLMDRMNLMDKRE